MNDPNDADNAYERYATQQQIVGTKCYLAMSLDGNLFKIGRTTEADTQRRHPSLPILWESTGNSEYEEWLHRQFAEYRVPQKREWYFAVPFIAMHFGLTFDRRQGRWRSQRAA